MKADSSTTLIIAKSDSIIEKLISNLSLYGQKYMVISDISEALEQVFNSQVYRIEKDVIQSIFKLNP